MISRDEKDDLIYLRYNEPLAEAIVAFEQIKKHATLDKFLTVFSENNMQLFSITKEQYELVINAAKTQVVISDEAKP